MRHLLMPFALAAAFAPPPPLDGRAGALRAAASLRPSARSPTRASLPFCLARKARPAGRGGKRGKRGKRRADDAGGAALAGRPRGAADMDAEERELSAAFVEDVKKPLRAGGARSKAGGKESRRGDGNKRGGGDNSGGWTGMTRLLEAAKRSRPGTREEALDLLVRGAWTGIFGLVGLFLCVHLLIVRDWLPGQ